MTELNPPFYSWAFKRFRS